MARIRSSAGADRGAITMKTVAADSMVKSLTDASYVAGEQGAPPLVANALASIIARGLPSGLEFGRFSIDYHCSHAREGSDHGPWPLRPWPLDHTL